MTAPGAARVALVTGAAGGLGSAIVERFSADGYTVERADQIRPGGAEDMRAHVCDVRDPRAWEGLAARLAARHGQIDAVVHAAGWYRPNLPFAELSPDLWHDHLAANLHSAYLACRFLFPLLSRHGSVLLFSSTLASRPTPLSLAYSVAKAGVETLVRGLAAEAGAKGQRINAIAPGPVDTPMLRGNALGAEGAAALMARLEARVPAGRLVTREEVAALAAYLCSPAAAMVNGAVIPLDGGQGI
ncbi:MULTISPECIES: SDR family NAD(P)-dependent oxidoreductase [unclassified Novosphingobium]|uniref:SDR family NAD(P)-dependent oxidoreductase n=1 Tax=unclassified Novosphingobium TaxID=2644732 RepID=UPI001494A0C1|nr:MULTISPECIES: SDR family oxidoreductase [unclassified Novosphingobium]MBB3358298.1 NAD(P)-dependent dehydrogenase (short-subunit alcohol dehydrogenase family) [Novosphingobium sp. BK256]MBB3374659.1 NAD(P)-dependent dehydrogenase (short-subunit alcohol dehydrogenase family) [Novosphingobium sp. BK280]MBB3379071.1 NAD(P)-dependent dehydrogenase (short-subunit alcohol dehydrogenase family) [Novosphingobium sp. BK258]MBB3420765.1 NAD(P)-dependent dehydrogenase (short-subunit alcohol dehydrogena